MSPSILATAVLLSLSFLSASANPLANASTFCLSPTASAGIKNSGCFPENTGVLLLAINQVEDNNQYGGTTTPVKFSASSGDFTAQLGYACVGGAILPQLTGVQLKELFASPHPANQNVY
ncbi:hypothetical protein BGZ63DRAFT_429701 [Mariannaea sp. PMI_226]|nr:hypothetical protein BGZ63DRAFT_429701 [Mariannaea sp. PMI_226]